jgi:hypothetical protein
MLTWLYSRVPALLIIHRSVLSSTSSFPLLYSVRARDSTDRRPFPELLADPAPLSSTPRGSLLARPLPAQPLLALPRAATLGRRCRGRHTAEGARRGTAMAPSVCGRPCAYSLPFCCMTTLYKTSTRSFPRSPPLSSSSRASTERRAVRRTSSPPRPTPSQFQRPKASSPPPLAPRPTLPELALLLGRNRGDPVPPCHRRSPRPLNVDDPLPPHLRNRIPATPRCSCALHLSAFAGPSP